ncbi:MAG: hypothetical protein NUV69_05130 [Candidatus Curtissbacteria bacterium]|nr:hypothetical protein [Candidatus Curtissbacteria bacterium]
MSFFLKLKYIFLILLVVFILPFDVYAVYDPINVHNNKVGIGLLSPESEIEEAASMVNSNGDWGYVLLLVTKNERDIDRWRGVFHQLSKYHLIPIVRIATKFDQGSWQRPEKDDAAQWAEFLSALPWPTKIRYVQVYNEVNHGSEWGGQVDPKSYTDELSKTISELKRRSDDFFVLGAPLDLALMENSEGAMSADIYFAQMEEHKGGIFKEFDGLASHSYPNPEFSASPLKSGRTGIDGYKWELSVLSPYLNGKNLPVFITETGWKRSEVLTEETVSDYFEASFRDIWNDERVVAVTPFIFNYPESLFYDFSFKVQGQVLGKKYFDQYTTIANLDKIAGSPAREDLASEIKSNIPEFVVRDVGKRVKITFKNKGHYIWHTSDLKLETNSKDAGMWDISFEKEEIFPGEDTNVSMWLKATNTGSIPLEFAVFNNSKLLSSKSYIVRSETELERTWRILKALI